MEEARAHRLGKADLGRHAWEDCMPATISRLLADEGASNELGGVIPQLVRLLEHDQDVASAYLCSPLAVQVWKLKGEGGNFCGYRNMQMLWLSMGSRVGGVGTIADSISGACEGSEKVQINSKKPSVIQLQDMIENAWDSGYNPHGRVQTGGIRGTRKHVGTPEAEALLQSMSIACTGHAFGNTNATDELLSFVESYFSSSDASTSSLPLGVQQTARLPIFLQRPHHSITIIGLDRSRSGKRRLLVFDPAYRPPSTMRELAKDEGQRGYDSWAAKWALRQYRKNERYLRRYRQFECLVIDV